MFTDSAYYKNSYIDFKDKKHPLFVGSVGTYRLFTKAILPTYRPRGRLDFQLLYVASGRAHFYINGTEKIVNAGNMVLYRPREVQRYYYYGIDRTEVYWVHFTGNNVKNILRGYGISDEDHVIHTGVSLEYKRIFSAMIQEMKLCKPSYEKLLVHYLDYLFILISRLHENPPSESTTFLMDEMDQAVAYFHANYNKPISIDNYAKEHGMSISWFIRNFKEYTKKTPTQYIMSLRISNAQNLIKSTDYNIAEIAYVVGYENPLYFSRIFKQNCGVSPKAFRNQFHSKESLSKK